jgi:ankyrin repeat protein
VLLENGARIAGNNALYHALDFDDLAALELLLRYGADANEPLVKSPHTEWGSPLLWAIRRRRSRRHVAALLKAGADPSISTLCGVSAYSLALQLGLGEVAELLRGSGGAKPLSKKSCSFRPARVATRQRPNASAPDGPTCPAPSLRRSCVCSQI